MGEYNMFTFEIQLLFNIMCRAAKFWIFLQGCNMLILNHRKMFADEKIFLF